MSRALSEVGHADYLANGYGGEQPELVIDYGLIERAEARRASIDSDFLDSNGLDLLAELRDWRAKRPAERAASAGTFLTAWAGKLAEFHADHERRLS